MNTLSLNRLWSFLQSLNLTASNRAWLADHLYETLQENTSAIQIEHTSTSATLLQEEELPEIVRNLIGVAEPVADNDVNGREAYYSHLAQKYA